MARKKASRARQRPSDELGVVPWQRDFWLLLIEHAQQGLPGPPDLATLPGFAKPAVTRFAATTPDLLRGFRAYNQGKRYHRQVRPFGFMLMFQQGEEELDAIWFGPTRATRPPTTMLRVIAPFDRDPAKAAKKAFDRDTGRPVPVRQLKRYVRALQSYHAHPEGKFLNGGHADRGPTQRRHLIARSIRHIGKEANKLDTQLATGVDPSAQAEFGTGRDNLKARFAAIKRVAESFGPIVLSREARISRQHLSAFLRGKGHVTATMLERLEQAGISLEVQWKVHAADSEEALKAARYAISKIGLRRFAALAGIDAGHFSRVLGGTRSSTPVILSKVRSTLEVFSTAKPSSSISTRQKSTNCPNRKRLR